MTSKLVVNTIESDTGISSVSFASSISMSSTSKFHFSAAGIDIGADTNINRPAAGVLGFNINGTEKVRIDTNGHIHGVGVVTATSLDISGDIDVDGHTNLDNVSIVGVTTFNGLSTNDVIRVRAADTNGISVINILAEGTTGHSRIKFSDTAGTDGQISYTHTDRALTFAAGGTTEKVRITSTGEMGVNTTVPVEKLGISGNMRFVNPNGTTSRITALPSGTYTTGTSGGSAICFQRIADGAGGSDEIFFETHWQGNRHGESCRINKYGNLAFPNGQGIDFSATSDGTSYAANQDELLDDYESGTFSPLLKRLSGGSEASYYNQSVREGFYTKVGTRVTISGRCHWSGGSTGSGTLILTHLPYTPKSSGTAIGANEVPIVVGYRSGLNYPRITGYLQYQNSRFIIQYVDSSGSFGSFDLSPSATNNSGHFYFTATYEAT